MKLKQALLPLAALSLAASLAIPSAALADDDAAYSANVVGVIKYSIPGNGGLVCVSLPLNPMGSNENEWLWVDSPLAQQLAVGSTAYFWDGTAWQPSTKGRWGWDGDETQIVEAGESFFIQTPSSSVATNIALLGELPLDEELAISLRGSDNLDTRCVTRYPVAIADFSASELANSLAINSTVYFWDGNAWQPTTKGRWGWDGEYATHSVAVGEGVFIQSSASSPSEVVMENPYKDNIN